MGERGDDGAQARPALRAFGEGGGRRRVSLRLGGAAQIQRRLLACRPHSRPARRAPCRRRLSGIQVARCAHDAARRRRASGASRNRMTFGEVLAAKRGERGITIEQAAAATRIRAHYLSALESNELERLAAPVYANSHLRTYARYPRLDPEPL